MSEGGASRPKKKKKKHSKSVHEDIPEADTHGGIELKSPKHEEQVDASNQVSLSSSSPPISTPDEAPSLDLERAENAPKPIAIGHAERLSFLRLYLLFLSFGIRAFGGPAVQIQVLKQEFVERRNWISMGKFNRVLAVYQALPGPEATELCCYFGFVSHGRIGAVAAGLGFITPGFICLLVAAVLYDRFGIDSIWVSSSLRSLRACCSALVMRATHKLAENAVENSKTKKFEWPLLLLLGLGALMTVMRIQFFITLAFCAVLNFFVRRRWWWCIPLVLLAGLAGYICYVVFVGVPSAVSLSVPLGTKATLGKVFLLGLLGGMLTFGGAYTAIPFIRASGRHFFTTQQFLDAIAIGSVVPTPLVMFVDFLGYLIKGVPGSVLITLGMFIPAFSFTIIGHPIFEWIIAIDWIGDLLDGVTAAVVGLVFLTACDLARDSVTNPQLALVYGLTIGALYIFKNRYTNVAVVFAAAIAGQALFNTT